MPMAIIGDVGSGFTPPIAVKAFASLVITGVGGFARVMGHEGWNDLAVGSREGTSDLAGRVRVLSESLISPSRHSREIVWVVVLAVAFFGGDGDWLVGAAQSAKEEWRGGGGGIEVREVGRRGGRRPFASSR